jgi:GNAT superfamily N-acetyltransferase
VNLQLNAIDLKLVALPFVGSDIASLKAAHDWEFEGFGLLTPDHQLFAIEHHGGLIGYVRLFTPRPTIEVIEIAEPYQRCGIGSAVVRDLQARYPQLRAANVVLEREWFWLKLNFIWPEDIEDFDMIWHALLHAERIVT